MNKTPYRQTFVISEPVKPFNFSATTFKSNSGEILTPLRQSFSNANLVSSSGSPMKTLFSKRRRKASSISQGWLVAANTIMIFSSLKQIKFRLLVKCSRCPGDKTLRGDKTLKMDKTLRGIRSSGEEKAIKRDKTLRRNKYQKGDP